MLISNVFLFDKEGLHDIHVDNGKIRSVYKTEQGFLQKNSIHLQFENALAFPGLINSHDHLDFNCFPQMGNGIYESYRQWGADIHLHNKGDMDAVLKIPQELRTQWGIYKNLLNGVTTVVNHGCRLGVKDACITVLQNNHSLHSVGFEKNWKRKLNNPFKKKLPYVIHVGEGKDDQSAIEIDNLVKWNPFKKPIIGVHGVAMNERQAKAFKALVWCPVSNFFLLGTTASVDELKESTAIVFGTDSTLTAGWNIWEHLRLARKQNSLSDEALFNAVTGTAAQVWGITDRGRIKEGMIADIIIAKATDNSYDSFYSINPEDILLVLHKGKIRLFDETIAVAIDNLLLNKNFFSPYSINGHTKFIEGDLSFLLASIQKYYPDFVFPFMQ